MAERHFRCGGRGQKKKGFAIVRRGEKKGEERKWIAATGGKKKGAECGSREFVLEGGFTAAAGDSD